MTQSDATDRQLLRELAYLYARLVDDRNYALASQVFCEDAELVGPGFEMKGLTAIRKALQSIERYSATLHSVHNQLVEIRGDGAEGETYCVANHLHERHGRPYKLDWGIRYRDRFRREESGWRFARRELTVVWEQDLPLAETGSSDAR